MLKNLKNLMIGILSAVIVIAIGASAYTAFASAGTAPIASPDSSTADYGNGNGNGNGGDNGSGSGTYVLDIPASDLNAEESASLLFMREEEKLARDVYNTLYAVWGQSTFQNIASSEQMHMDQMKVLLDRYALVDPALAPGQFTDPSLRALYDQLAAQGSLSLADALKAGAAIEEIDILDLQTRLAQTDNADIQVVFNNLMNGSYNHLQAFTSTLTQQTGEVYQPQYLSVELYQSIIANAAGNGSQGGTGIQGGNGNGNGGTKNSISSNTAVPQASITGVSTVHGFVNSYDLSGLSITLDDGSSLYVQLGNSRYSQSIGFVPQAGEGVTITGFPGDQGLYSAINVTFDPTSQTYSFRDASGRPLWSGGNGKGNGGNH